MEEVNSFKVGNNRTVMHALPLLVNTGWMSMGYLLMQSKIAQRVPSSSPKSPSTRHPRVADLMALGKPHSFAGKACSNCKPLTAQDLEPGSKSIMVIKSQGFEEDEFQQMAPEPKENLSNYEAFLNDTEELKEFAKAHDVAFAVYFKGERVGEVQSDYSKANEMAYEILSKNPEEEVLIQQYPEEVYDFTGIEFEEIFEEELKEVSA